MDFCDIEVIVMPVKAPAFFLNENLWRQSPDRQRAHYSPLYIDRHVGPRQGNVMSQHDFWEITLILSGGGVFMADREYSLSPDTIILTPPRCLHREEAGGNIDSIWLGLFGDLPLPGQDVPIQLVSARLREKILELWSLSARNSGGIGMELDGLTLQVIGLLLRLAGSQDKNEPPMELAVKYLNEHYHESIGMDELSGRCGMSTGHFFRQFKNFTGKTPVEFLTSLRLRNAMFWLTSTTVPICRIAEITGFGDPYYFSRAFRKHTGISPSEFRKNAPLH